MPKCTLTPATHTHSHPIQTSTHTRKHTRTVADNLHIDIHSYTHKNKPTITHTQSPLWATVAATSAQATSKLARAQKPRVRRQITRASKREGDQGDRAASIYCWQGEIENTKDVNGKSDTERN